MQEHSPLERIISKIQPLCRQQESIVAAYLFGSQATGRAAADSDIDLALLLDRDTAAGFDLLAFIVALEKLTARQADVVVLNRAPELLKFEVRRTGRLIYEKEAAARKSFEVSSRKSFEDFLFLHRRYAKSKSVLHTR